MSPSVTEANGSNIEAVVKVVEAIGAETFLYLERGKQSLVARVNGEERARVKEKLAVSFDFSGAQFFDPTNGKAVEQR